MWQELKTKVSKRIIKRLMTPPVNARHWEHTCFFSADDEIYQPNKRILELSTRAIQEAQNINLSKLAKRLPMSHDFLDPNLWPGEHYKLLAALVKVVKPAVVIEIGTFIGLSALALKEYLPENGTVYTFDIIPWQECSPKILSEKDFEDQNLVQYLDDLSTIEGNKKHKELLQKADIIFVDAKKDGIMERKFITFFEQLSFNSPPIILFDDIKNWMMLDIWREIKHPKLDITSFGHYTGTGIVEWI